MTRLARWLSPYRALWLRERDDHTRTRARLAVVTAERDGAVALLALCSDQRERARALAAALVAAPEWTEGDDVWMRDHGVAP